jgi:hypothetical protein
MIDAGSTWFRQSLEARLCEVRQEYSTYLVTGSAQDFANYRERVGYIRAIDHILAICDEIAKEGSDDIRQGRQDDGYRQGRQDTAKPGLSGKTEKFTMPPGRWES